MEVRRLLSTVIVNTLADETLANGTTSLREAITLAAAGDTVQFKVGLRGQIALSKGVLVLATNITIAGPGAATITVSGNTASRVFGVNSNVNATISGITITDGKAETGGGIYVDVMSRLTLSKVTLVGNNARGVDGDATNGGDAKGGAVYTAGLLDVTDCEFRANGAIGGEGHIGIGPGDAGNAAGGAVYVESVGVLAALRTKFIDNGALGGVADGDFGAFGGGNGGYAQGGAVLNTNDSRFTGCTFESNLAVGSDGGHGDLTGGTGGAAWGGAVYSTGQLTLVSTVLSKNGANAGDGGIGMDGLANGEGGEASGGAVFVSNDFMLDDSTVNANYAIAGNLRGAIGGGIAAFGSTGVYGSTIAGNTAKGDQIASDNPAGAGAASHGGGIFLGGFANAIFTSTISNNAVIGGVGGSGYELHGTDHLSAPGGEAQGGGVFVTYGLTMNNSTVANNSGTGGTGGAADIVSQSPGAAGGAASGGGIYAVEGAEAELINTTIAGNNAIGGKGGAAGLVIPGLVQLPAGATGWATAGGVFAGGQVAFSNTIIAANTAKNAGRDVVGQVVSNGFNLVGTATDSGGWIASDRKGTNAAPLNAKLSGLANNGGKNLTMLPQSGSPAIDKGKAFNQLLDQRGLLRTFDVPGVSNASGGDGTDIGAVEVQSTPFSGAPIKVELLGSTTIEVEHFNSGAEGIAYHDVDVANLGGAFRTTSRVDVQSVQNDAGKYNVGWIKAGEWLTYTVDVDHNTQTYDVDFRVASNGVGGKFHLEVDGKNVTGSLSVPNTGGWQAWKTLTKSGVTLNYGRHVLRLVMESVGPQGSVGNFNYIRLNGPAAPQQVTVNTTAAAHVRDGSFAGANYGSSPTLEVKRSTTGYNREAFLKFDLSGVSSFSNAKLRLFGHLMDEADVELAVFGVANQSWGESTLTWNTKPAVGAAPLKTDVMFGTTATWIEFDLTNYLSAEKAAGRNVMTLAVRGVTVTSTVCQFNSDEAASNRPELVLTT